ncbi:MAG: hypothetical protein KR126chlam1_00256 [Chlamydiae bacterium]|nr:hypothetical protein [Chlamydiota bacterium]
MIENQANTLHVESRLDHYFGNITIGAFVGVLGAPIAAVSIVTGAFFGGVLVGTADLVNTAVNSLFETIDDNSVVVKLAAKCITHIAVAGGAANLVGLSIGLGSSFLLGAIIATIVGIATFLILAVTVGVAGLAITSLSLLLMPFVAFAARRH